MAKSYLAIVLGVAALLGFGAVSRSQEFSESTDVLSEGLVPTDLRPFEAKFLDGELAISRGRTPAVISFLNYANQNAGRFFVEEVPAGGLGFGHCLGTDRKNHQSFWLGFEDGGPLPGFPVRRPELYRIQFDYSTSGDLSAQFVVHPQDSEELTFAGKVIKSDSALVLDKSAAFLLSPSPDQWTVFEGEVFPQSEGQANLAWGFSMDSTNVGCLYLRNLRVLRDYTR